MLLHGDRDSDVPRDQSVQMAVALKREGVDHVFVSVPGGEHGFDGSADPVNTHRFAHVLAFLRHHLR
jgi:dipeptidyl aminopeptidase/acylaminoacyl peptidase